MSKNKTNNIVFLLDETGSMEDCKSDTIGGFNNFLKTQKKSKENIKLSITLFNSSKIEKRYINEPIENVELLSKENYNPSNLTPLWDAIGTTIKELNNKKNVLFVILTDGEENSSKEFVAKTVKKLIKEKEKKLKWSFLFLGADLNNFNDAGRLGITQNYSVNKKNMKKAYSKLSETVTYYCETGITKFDNSN